MASIHFEDVGKVFPEGTVALEALDLDVEDAELMVLVGPSGSGKSTALRILAGLEDATSGTVRIGERVVNEVEPKDRDIAMVFQSYALYPHMTVEDNIGFPLRMHREPKPSIRERVRDTAGRLDVGGLLQRRPRQLSGGQRQRVALGRAIVREPQAFLMDEPLSNLDAKLRVEMRAYVQELHRRLDKTIVYVTHDQIEAMTMGDRVAVLRDGRLEQVDSPQALYDRPASLFVAAFIGSPAMNLLPPGAFDDRNVIVGIRPEALHPAQADEPAIEGWVALVESLGSDLLVHVDIEAGERLVARLEPTVRAEPGERIALSVAPERLHFFDPTTELALR
jgi:multiple sugar transport system ATP-binding protein